MKKELKDKKQDKLMTRKEAIIKTGREVCGINSHGYFCNTQSKES